MLAFPRMFLMVGLFGFLFWNNLRTLPLLKVAGLLIVVAGAYFIFVKSPQNDSKPLIADAPLLTYDYGVNKMEN
jgi:hypothetical protein